MFNAYLKQDKEKKERKEEKFSLVVVSNEIKLLISIFIKRTIPSSLQHLNMRHLP